MRNTEQYKRLLILHLLGIPIKEPYVLLFDTFLKFLDVSKKIVITPYGDEEIHTCYIDKKYNIVFSTYEYESNNEKTTQLLINFIDNYYQEYQDLFSSYHDIIEEIMYVVLKNKKIEFDELHTHTIKDTMIGDNRPPQYFKILKKLYDSGNFELLNF